MRGGMEEGDGGKILADVEAGASGERKHHAEHAMAAEDTMGEDHLDGGL